MLSQGAETVDSDLNVFLTEISAFTKEAVYLTPVSRETLERDVRDGNAVVAWSGDAPVGFARVHRIPLSRDLKYVVSTLYIEDSLSTEVKQEIAEYVMRLIEQQVKPGSKIIMESTWAQMAQVWGTSDKDTVGERMRSLGFSIDQQRNHIKELVGTNLLMIKRSWREYFRGFFESDSSPTEYLLWVYSSEP